MFIRTGGEQRINNFLLWQLAYTELHFTQTLWPVSTAPRWIWRLTPIASAERRFGRTTEQLDPALRRRNDPFTGACAGVALAGPTMLIPRIITAVFLVAFMLGGLFYLPAPTGRRFAAVIILPALRGMDPVSYYRPGATGYLGFFCPDDVRRGQHRPDAWRRHGWCCRC